MRASVRLRGIGLAIASGFVALPCLAQSWFHYRNITPGSDCKGGSTTVGAVFLASGTKAHNSGSSTVWAACPVRSDASAQAFGSFFKISVEVTPGLRNCNLVLGDGTGSTWAYDPNSTDHSSGKDVQNWLAPNEGGYEYSISCQLSPGQEVRRVWIDGLWCDADESGC